MTKQWRSMIMGYAVSAEIVDRSQLEESFYVYDEGLAVRFPSRCSAFVGEVVQGV